MRNVVNGLVAGVARLWSKGCLGKGAVVFGALIILGICSAILGGGNRGAQTGQTPGQQAPTAAPQLAAVVPTEPPAPTDAPRPTRAPKPTATTAPTDTPEPTKPPAQATAAPEVFTKPDGVPPVSKLECPPNYPIKGNVNSKGEHIYHLPHGDSSYSRTTPVRCYATAADAEGAGYRAPKNN
jgi:hypothetical protein